MSIYTIFFCGTGSNRTDSLTGGKEQSFYHAGELISTLAKNMATDEYKDWIILDGPGSGNLQEKEKWVKPGNHYEALGGALGAGVGNNIAHALAVLKKDNSYFSNKKGYSKQEEQYASRISNESMPTQVNLVGWSRGGMSCHLMANAMRKDPDLCNIPVNIFAIDPVPGPFRFNKKTTYIGKNVKEYYAIYARDERTRAFGPILSKFHNTGPIHIYGLPGRHATLVGNASSTGHGEPTFPTALTEAGTVARWLVEKKLKDWGVRLNNCLPLSEADILGEYDRMLGKDEEYKALRTKFKLPIPHSASLPRGIALGGLSRIVWHKVKMLREPAEDVKPRHPIFVNNHHMNLYINEMQSKLEFNNTENFSFPETQNRINSIDSKEKLMSKL